MKVTNTTNGPKVVNSTPPAILTPGGTMDLDISEGELKAMESTEWFEFGDAKPAALPRGKADLIAVAKAEGVEIDDDMTASDIKAAIELHREG
jgi:hypothetical protein